MIQWNIECARKKVLKIISNILSTPHRLGPFETEYRTVQKYVYCKVKISSINYVTFNNSYVITNLIALCAGQYLSFHYIFIVSYISTQQRSRKSYHLDSTHIDLLYHLLYQNGLLGQTSQYIKVD